MSDWLGSGARSIRDIAEKIITEALRRMRLALLNDPTIFVPPLSDVSTVLANRIFTHTPSLSSGSATSGGDASTILAALIFGRRPDPRIPAPYLGATELYGRLHLMPGAGQIVLDTSALAAGTYLLDIGGAAGADRSLARIGVAGAGLTATYRTATTTVDWLFSGTKSFTIDAGGITVTGNSLLTGSLTVTGAFGCNGAAAQTSVTLPTSGSAVTGTAGLVYTAVEQTMLNDLEAQVNILTTLVSTIRTALINDGIGA